MQTDSWQANCDTEGSPEPTRRVRKAERLCGSMESLLGASNVAVRLSFDLKSEQAKVDSLQTLLVQRENQKQAFFLQSLKKEEECTRLREQLLQFQAQQPAPDPQLQGRIQELETQLARARLLPLFLCVLLVLALFL